MGLNPANNPIRVTVISWVWGAYLGDEGLTKGIRLKTSAFTRHHVRIMMTKTKTVGNYVNSILAKREALQAGYDEAILLDPEGYVAEASGENVFLVKNGVLRTPPLSLHPAGYCPKAGDPQADVGTSREPRHAAPGPRSQAWTDVGPRSHRV